MVEIYRTSGSLATLSFAGALIVVLSYFSMAELRRHPTKLVFFLSLSDLFFSIKFIITSIYPDSMDLQGRPFACYSQAFFLQFWGLASLSWNGIISLNLILNLNNPFSNTGSYVKFYHIWVWGLSSITTIIMFCFPDHIGASGDGTCWIKSYSDPLRLMFFVPLLIYFASSIGALIVCFIRTKDAIGPVINTGTMVYSPTVNFSDESRRGMILRMAAYVAVFVLCWSGPVLHRAFQLAKNEPDNPKNPSPLMYWDAVGVAVQGFANAMVWLTNPSFFRSFRKIVDKVKCLFPCLNTMEETPLLDNIRNKIGDTTQDISRIDQVLRKNVITCILLGIRVSVQDGSYSSLDITQQSYKQSKRYGWDQLVGGNKGDNLYPSSSSSSTNNDQISSTDLRSLPSSGNRQEYVFLDFCPAVFHRLRELRNITTSDYKHSMDPSVFLRNLDDQKFSEGRGGSFFVFSPNRCFVMKTITKGEAKLLLEILPQMYSHLSLYENSLLVRFYGLHAIETPQGARLHVVIMSNVFNTSESIHEPYDLKGSWINRHVGPVHDANPSKLGMDLDMKRKLRIPQVKKEQFIEQITNDAKFLCSLNIMDYSLLLGFHFRLRNADVKVNIPNSTTSVNQIQLIPLSSIDSPSNPTSTPIHTEIGRIESVDGLEVYFMGVIDILQLYDKSKKLERFLKVYILRKNPLGISCIGPREYFERFVKAMQNICD